MVLLENRLAIPPKLNTEFLSEPARPLPGICPHELKAGVRTDSCSCSCSQSERHLSYLSGLMITELIFINAFHSQALQLCFSVIFSFKPNSSSSRRHCFIPTWTLSGLICKQKFMLHTSLVASTQRLAYNMSVVF